MRSLPMYGTSFASRSIASRSSIMLLLPPPPRPRPQLLLRRVGGVVPRPCAGHHGAGIRRVAAIDRREPGAARPPVPQRVPGGDVWGEPHADRAHRLPPLAAAGSPLMHLPA